MRSTHHLALALGAVLLSATVSHAAVVRLTWDAPELGTPLGYTMYRAVNGGQFEVLSAGANIPATTRAFTDNRPVLGDNCYQVTAHDAEGESGPSNVVCKTFQIQDLAISAPQSLRITN